MNLNTIGLAYVAKKAIVSLDNIFEYVKKKKVYIVFAAKELSNSSMQKLEECSTKYSFIINNNFTEEELSKALGLNKVKAVGIIDKGFYELTNK